MAEVWEDRLNDGHQVYHIAVVTLTLSHVTAIVCSADEADDAAGRRLQGSMMRAAACHSGCDPGMSTGMDQVRVG